MSSIPRLRQSCHRDHRTRIEAVPGDAARAVVNDLVLTGILAADPETDEGRDGKPVTLLLIAFPAPDSRDLQEPEAACCEVEVPDGVAARAARKLCAGESVRVIGQLSGGGGVIASEVRPGPLDLAA